MTTFNVGDRVRDAKWGGEYVGTVKRIDPDGDLYVAWDGTCVEDQIDPDGVRPLGAPTPKTTTGADAQAHA